MKQILQLAILLPAALLGGCGGHYILAAGDQLSTPQGELAIVARIQHNEVRSVDVAVANQTISVRLYPFGQAKSATQTDAEVPARSREFGTISNADGYVALTMPLDEKPIYNTPGKYDLKLSLQSPFGDQKYAVVPVYVVDKNRPLVAVDLEALPAESFFVKDAPAAKALRHIAAYADIVYYAAHSGPTRQRIHAELLGGGYPDGAVLLWQPHRWQVTRSKRFYVPTDISFQRSLENNIPAMRKQFPNFKFAITSRYLAAQTFATAGLDVFAVTAKPFTGDVINIPSWSALAPDVLAKLGHAGAKPPQPIRGIHAPMPGVKPTPAPVKPGVKPKPATPVAPIAPIRMSDLKPKPKQ